jgi:hypothetical protein
MVAKEEIRIFAAGLGLGLALALALVDAAGKTTALYKIKPVDEMGEVVTGRLQLQSSSVEDFFFAVWRERQTTRPRWTSCEAAVMDKLWLSQINRTFRTPWVLLSSQTSQGELGASTNANTIQARCSTNGDGICGGWNGSQEGF